MILTLIQLIVQINSANSVAQIEKIGTISIGGLYSQTPEKFVSAYNDEKFDSLSNLFQYPSNQNITTHKEDSTLLYCLFSVMKLKWGPITDYKKVKIKNDSYAEISINTADSLYWNKKKYLCKDTSYYEISYLSDRKLITGFIQCDFDKVPKIGFYKFIVPYPENPTEEQINELNARLKAVMQKMIQLGLEQENGLNSK